MSQRRELSPTYTLRGFRRRLASIDALVQFSILGIFSGIITGVVILLFRIAIEFPLTLLLPGGRAENFEALPKTLHLLLPLAGAAAIGLVFTLLSEERRKTGVTHVLERISRHQGHMPLTNFVVQFFGGIAALLSGQACGREGPAIHLGAASSSLLGQVLELPNNSIRVLVGCGSAAAISASFNTPLAGVVFSMEVIMMEYSIAGFIPVILASVFATLISHIAYGHLPAFRVPPVSMHTFLDVPYVIMEGIVIGALAAGFIYAVRFAHNRAPAQTWLRLTCAGLITGVFALFVPEVLGIGYDTVNSALLGHLGIVVLLAACILKLIASAASVGLGVPAGLIGPTIFIGATAGGVFGVIAGYVMPGAASPDSFYVMLGMGAMMGAVLQAPLAALLAVVELTENPAIVMPAMLVIVVANLTASEVFKRRSLFVEQMETLGLEFRRNPLSLALNRSSVASIMERNFERLTDKVAVAAAREAVREKPRWILVDGDTGPRFLLRTEDLITYLDQIDDTVQEVDLAAIPATRMDVAPILLRATLQEALDTIIASHAGALYVNRISGPLLDSVVGIVTRGDIESHYLT